MSFDYFSKNRVQYILTKLKDIFDTKANISDVPDTFADLTDVEITSPVSGQIPVYNPTTGKWVNGRKVIFSTSDPAVNTGDELDVYIKISSNDYGKSFRVYTKSTGSENASIAVDTIISGEVTRTDTIGYRSPARTYSDFTTNYYSSNWRVNITTDNVDGHPRGEEIAWGYYTSKNLSLTISPPIVYGVYIKSNGIWVNCKDTPISTFADLTDTAFTNLQNGQVAIYNSTTGKWENGNVSSANDGVLTIQKNGTTVQTFSANQSTDVTANITVPTTAADVGAIPTTQKGVASGVAELDSNGKVPSSQLPSFVDDTVEGYLYEGHWYSDAEHTQEVVGETGKIYVELSTNKTYRWSGTTFVEISESLALGETSSTAYRGDRGATAYSHATDANKVSSATDTGLYKVGATAEGHISELQAVQKSDITNLGIPGAVKLTITVSESEDPQTGDEVLVADKTPSEVLAALNGGMVVEVVYEGGVYLILNNSLSTGGTILFGATAGDNNVGMFHQEIYFTKDSQNDTWESIELISTEALESLHASISYSDNTYSCDYTYSEVEDARSNGLNIFMYYNSEVYNFVKYDSSENTFYFSTTLADSDEVTTKTFVMVGDDTTGDWTSITKYETNGSGDVIWTGTQAEYEAQASQIPVGAYVNITDDEQIIPYASAIRWEEASTSVKKNLLPSEIVSQTQNGLTFTVNADKSITVSGTASAITVLVVGYIDVKAGVQYKLTGGVVSDHTHLDLRKNNVTWTANTSGKAVISPKPSYGIDTFVPNSDDTLACCIRIANGENLTTPITFYPMIRLSSIVDNTYVPYIPDNTELVDWKSNGVLGAKNFLNWSFESLKYNSTGTWNNNAYTHNGITYTINSDGTITVNGTCTTANAYLAIYECTRYLKPNVPYRVTGCPSGGSGSTYWLQVNSINSSGSQVGNMETGNGIIYTTSAIKDSGDHYPAAYIYVKLGQTVSNLVFKPMVRLASDTDDTYVPHAPTNRQLFADIVPIKIEAKTYTSSTLSQIVKTILDNIVDGGNYQQRSFMGGFVWSGNDHYTIEGFFGSRYARGSAYTKDTIYWFNYDSNTKQLSAPTSITPGTLPVWTSSVSALTGATSVTITNANIHTTSVIEPFADNGTNTAMSMPTMTVTEGQCVLGFDALTADTTFKLRITN